MSLKKWTVLGLGLLSFSCCLFLLPCVQTVRNGEGYSYSQASLREIGEALLGYFDQNGRLPPAKVRDRAGRTLYSWRVVLLPFLDAKELYQQFKLDEPWDSPDNKKLLEQMPKCYKPKFGGDDAPGLTRYRVLVGPGTAF